MKKVHKNRDKSDENCIQKASQKASGASKMSPAASRRRPRASKKRPGGAKLDLVVFYRLFKLTQVTGWNALWSPNNLPVREVNRIINIQNTNLLCELGSNLLPPNTHWCARGHGADSIAYAHSAGPGLI